MGESLCILQTVGREARRAAEREAARGDRRHHGGSDAPTSGAAARRAVRNRKDVYACAGRETRAHATGYTCAHLYTLQQVSDM